MTLAREILFLEEEPNHCHQLTGRRWKQREQLNLGRENPIGMVLWYSKIK